MAADDDRRLEEGLTHLQRLGYLQSPAELYVARRMPERAGALRSSAVAAVWIGAGGGILVGLILWLTAVLADPTLLDRPGDLLWLFFDFVLVAANAGLVLVLLSLWPLLRWLRRTDEVWATRLQRAAVLIPGTLLTLYLADALGRHFLPYLSPQVWTAGLATSALVASSLGALVSLFLGALVAVARLRLRGVWNPVPVSRAERLRPWLLDLLLAALLLLAGPYRDFRQLPRLDQIQPVVTELDPEPILVVALDGLAREDLRLQGPRPHANLVPWSDPGAPQLRIVGEHPGAFWNTVATGFESEEHGYLSPESAAPRGVEGQLDAFADNPILSTLFRHLLPGMGMGSAHAADQRELARPPYWEVAARAGRNVGTVNWWATYPAARHPRLHVASDRWFLRLWGSREEAAADSFLFSPRDLRSVVRRRPGFSEDLLQNAFAFRARHTAAQTGDSLLTRTVFPDVEGWNPVSDTWAYATTSDAFHVLLAVGLLELGDRDAVTVHLNGLDILARRILAMPPTDRLLQRESLRLLEIYVDYLDQLVGDLVEAGPERVLLLGSVERAGAASRQVWGGFRSGQGPPEPIPPRVEELVPQVLRSLGIAPARDMAGPAPDGPRTYGRRPNWTPAAGRESVDLDRLRSLGYVGG